MIFVRKLTPLRVIGEILKLKKNRYSHIDSCILVAVGQLKLEEILDDLLAFGMILVKKLRVKLDAIQAAPFLLHRLNLTGLV